MFHVCDKKLEAVLSSLTFASWIDIQQRFSRIPWDALLMCDPDQPSQKRI